MGKPKTWREVEVTMFEAGVTKKAVEERLGFSRNILGRVMGFDPDGYPAAETREAILGAVEELKEGR